jgi:hypothetical protein
MRKTLLAIAAAAVLMPASGYAKDSSDLALALGTILGSEEFCGLDYDQAAIQAFVRKRVSPDDMGFPSSLESMTAETMSDSAKTAHCTQIARIAKSYGFTH